MTRKMAFAALATVAAFLALSALARAAEESPAPAAFEEFR